MSTRKAIPGLLLAAALSVSPALAEGPSTGAGSVQVIDRVVARVGPEAITHREVQTVLSQTPGGTYNQALEALIDRTLVLVWARDKNIVVAPGDVDRVQETIMLQNNMDEEQFRQALSERGQSLESFRQSLRDQITISRAVEMALGAHVKVQEEELLRSYEEYYPPRERFTLRHILLRTEAGSDAEQMAAVKERAEEILSRARAGASFGDLARRHSEDDSSAAAGGYLGTFQRGEMIPELEKAALGLEVGQPGGPVRTSMGYHVLMLESRDTAPPPPLSTVRDELERALSAEKRQKAQEEWLKELRRQAYIETFPEAR